MSALKRAIFVNREDIAFAVLKDDFKPYVVSNKPITSSKDYMGNRDCIHRQFHGEAFINDFGSGVTRFDKKSCSPWGKWFGWNYAVPIKMQSGDTWYLTKAVYPGLVIEEFHNLYYDKSYNYFIVPIYRYASFDGSVGIYIDISTGANFSSWPTDSGYHIWLNYRYVWYDADKGLWYTIKLDPLNLSDIELPEGCSWRDYIVPGTSSDSVTVSYCITVHAYNDRMHELFKEWPGFLETLIRDISARLRIHMSKPDGHFETAISGNHHIRFLSGKPHYLKKSDFPRIREELITFSKINEPFTDLTILVGNATQSAADAARDFTGNTGTLINELLHLKETLLDLYKMLQGEVNPKTLSSLYLQGKYGLKLTAQDTMELAQRIGQQIDSSASLYSVARGSASSGKIVCHCKLYYDQGSNNAFAKLMYDLQSWDLFPSFQNVWDIIPYSFVADWFVDIEGFLSAIDARTFISTMNIFRVLYSIKKEWEGADSVMTSYGIVGNVSFSDYQRWSESEPWPVVPTFSGKDPSNHIIEGSALIIQRL